MAVQTNGASPALGSARSMRVGGRDLKYGPLPYRVRGEVENLYFPEAKGPAERIEEMVSTLPEPERAAYDDLLRDTRKMALGYRLSIESPDAAEFFTADAEHWASFLSASLPVFNAFREDPDWSLLAGEMTKGQRMEMYAQSLEIGAYAPKSLVGA